MSNVFMDTTIENDYENLRYKIRYSVSIYSSNKPTGKASLSIEVADKKIECEAAFSDGIAKYSGSLYIDYTNSDIGFTTYCIATWYLDGGGWDGASSITENHYCRKWDSSTISDTSTKTYEINGINPVKINILRGVVGSVHTVKIKLGSDGLKSFTVNNVENTTEYVIPMSWIEGYPSVKTFTLYIEVTQYIKGHQIGDTVSKTITANVTTVGINPIITGVSLERVNNEVPQEWEMFVQYVSSAKFTINATGKYGATISKYSIKTSNGVQYLGSESSFTTDIIKQNGKITAQLQAIDSRGFESDIEEVTFDVTPYFKPDFANAIINRCNEDGTFNEDGDFIRLEGAVNIAACDGKNSISETTVQAKSINETSYINKGQLELSGATIIGGFDAEKTYDIKIIISDAIRSSVFEMELYSSLAVMGFMRGGRGISFGKSPETDGFDCAFDATFRGALNVGNTDIVELVNGINKKRYMYYAECLTAANEKKKLISIDDFYSYENANVVVRFTNGISVNSPTLSINEGEELPIMYRGSAVPNGYVRAGCVLMLQCNGTKWDVIGEFAQEIIGNLSSLGTNAKDSVVAAVNEVNTKLQDFKNSIAQTNTGYFKLPGIIIQWGTVSDISVPATGNETITIGFPIQFGSPPSILCDELGNYNIKANPVHNSWVASFQMNIRSLDGNARTGRSVNWIAIGN